MTLLRRLNPVGMERLAAFLDSLKMETPQGIPVEILTHPDTSEDLGVAIEIDLRTFGSRLEAARYLDDKLSGSRLRNIERDRGIWAWLALFYFEELCPPDRNGRRQPGESARWIPEVNNAFRYYRHLLAGPYRIFRAYRNKPESALILLSGPLHKLGHFQYQLASRQEIVTNQALLQAATWLYLKPDTNTPKRGATSQGPGGVFRFTALVNQLDVTWDLYAMTPENILQNLPAEFDRFRAVVPVQRT